jgi:hypothetical protein
MNFEGQVRNGTRATHFSIKPIRRYNFSREGVCPSLPRLARLVSYADMLQRPVPFL